MWKFTYKMIILISYFMIVWLQKSHNYGDDLVMEFDDYGFWIGEKNKQNPYKNLLRTEKSELRFVDFDTWSNIYIFKRYNLFKKFFYTSRVDVSLDKFISNVNSGKWTFEFLYEYYANRNQSRAIFNGCINIKNKRQNYDCQIKADCSKMIYYWNKIREDASW